MKKNYLFVIFCLLVFVNACTNEMEDNELSSGLPVPNSCDLTYKNGMLILNNSNVLSKILENKLDVSNITFMSQQKIMDQLINEEEVYAKSLRELSDEEYDRVQKHSDLYNKLLNKKFIKVQQYTDGSEMYSLNVIAPNYAKVLNEQGFFAIKDTIFQVTSDKLKIWINGDLENLKLLSDIEKTDVKKNISVFDYNNGQNYMTRAIPSIQPRNQNVAYGRYNQDGTARTILTFCDQAILNAEEQCFNRNTYIRYSYQEKLDGRNFAFTPAPYSITLDLKLANRSDFFTLQTSGSGSNVFFTVYLNYEILNPGQQIQKITTKEDYLVLDEFIYTTETYLLTYKHIYLFFSGFVQKGSAGTIIYDAKDCEGIPFEPNGY